MRAFLVIDLGFGDAGKGSMVDYLVRRHGANTVVRFNGGAQAAHNVVLPEGRHHTFSQFGSGTFVPGVATHLSRFMLVDPVALLAEERHLRELGVADAFDRLSVDARAVVVAPFQKAANRLRELARGDGRHGSCGMGIGETMQDLLEEESMVLRVADLRDTVRMREKLRRLQAKKRALAEQLRVPTSPMAEREWRLLRDPAAVEEFTEIFAEAAARFAVVPSASKVLHAGGNVVFEGAQGALLDEWHGFHPYTTWSTTTFANALALLRECRYAGSVTRIGLTRAYMTRHGAGPFVTEDDRLSRWLPEKHNVTNAWQREFRAGWLDLVMLRYALEMAGGADGLGVTCLDHLAGRETWRVCRGYEGIGAEFYRGGRLRVTPQPDLDYQARLTAALQKCRPMYEEVPAGDVPGVIASALGVGVMVTSAGPTHAEKRAYAGDLNRKDVEAADCSCR